MDNEQRADLGHQAVKVVVGAEAGSEPAETSVRDALACMAHFCDRLGLDPEQAFAGGLESYRGDEEDGPLAEAVLDAQVPLEH